MSFEIGPTPPVRPASPAPAARSASFQAKLSSARADRAEISIPTVPPSEVRDAISVAADRADALAAMNRELHFEHDHESGRVIVQVRDLTSGEVVRTIPPSHALAVLSGGEL